jgi:hypothetical protein
VKVEAVSFFSCIGQTFPYSLRLLDVLHIILTAPFRSSAGSSRREVIYHFKKWILFASVFECNGGAKKVSAA